MAAHFQSRHSIQYAARGELAHLKCLAKGDWPISLHWLKNKHRLEPVNLQEAAGQASQQQQQAGSSLLTSSQASLVLLPSSLAGSPLANHSADLRQSVAEQLGAWLTAGAEQAVLGKTGSGLLLQRYSLQSSEWLLARPAASGAADHSLHSPPPLSLANDLRPRPPFADSSQPALVQLNSVLAIQQVERHDTGLFRCLAANHFGLDERTIQLIVQEPPDRIEELSVLEVNSRSITLGWLAPYDGNAPISHYHVQYRAQPMVQQTLNHFLNGQQSSQMSSEALNQLSWLNYTLAVAAPETGANQGQGQGDPANRIQPQQQQTKVLVAAPSGGRMLTRITINSLRPVTQYWFRVEAENKLGRGPISRATESITMEEAPGASPGKLKAVAQSSSSILVSWTKLNEKEIFGSVHGYYVAYKPLIESAPSASSPASNKSFSSSSSSSSSQADAADPNAAVTNIYKTIQNDEKLTKFDALLTGLRRSTKYVISVQAFNARGTGPSSEPVVVRTLEMDPPRQVKLFVKQASNSSIQLEWRPLSQTALAHQQQALKGSVQEPRGSTGSGPDMAALPIGLSNLDVVDYYSLYHAELNERPRWQEIRLVGHAPSHTIDRLKCGTRYQFYMVAVNRVGPGDQSDILDTKTAGGLPIAPDRQSTFDVTNATCYVVRLDHWQDNGCPIKRFNIRYRAESSTTRPAEWTQLAHFELGDDADKSAGSSAPSESPRAGSPGPDSIRSLLSQVGGGKLWRARRSTGEGQQQEYFMREEQDLGDQEGLLDYPSSASSSSSSSSSSSDSSSQAANFVDDFDYMSLEAASLISKSDPTGSEMMNLTGEGESQLFSLLKDSMMPSFEVGESQLELVSQPATVGGHQMAAAVQLPQVAREWQDSNFVVDEAAGSNQRRALGGGERTEPSKQPVDWRRVRLCNLSEGLYYNIQVTAENGVGETEAELRILASKEGLEYDQEIKRQVVGRLGGARAAPSAAMKEGLGGLLTLNQWPVLVPATLALTLVAIIVLATLLQRCLSPSSSPGGSPSTTATTATTTTTSSSSSSAATTTTTAATGGAASMMSGSNGGRCRSYFEGHQHHHHHHHGPPSSFHRSPGAPSSITEPGDGSDLVLGAAAVDNYATVVPPGSGRCHQVPAGGLNMASLYQGELEPVYGLLGGGLGAHGPTSLISSSKAGSSSQEPSNRTGNSSPPMSLNSGSGPSNGPDRLLLERGRSVYLCTAREEQQQVAAAAAAKQQEAAIFYGGPANGSGPGLGQQPQAIYGSQQIQLRRFQGEAERAQFPEGPEEVFEPAAGGLMGEKEAEANSNFLNIVEEVARANDTLGRQQQLALSSPKPGEQCQQADCLGHLHQQQPIDFDEAAPPAIKQRQQQVANGSSELTANRLMFDPVYATIRRTFPQAFRYLTLQQQHNSHHHNHHHPQQQQQQVSGGATAPTSNGGVSRSAAMSQQQQGHYCDTDHHLRQAADVLNELEKSSQATARQYGPADGSNLLNQLAAHDMALFGSNNLAALNLLTPTTPAPLTTSAAERLMIGLANNQQVLGPEANNNTALDVANQQQQQ